MEGPGENGSLDEALESALAGCRQALADYQAGLLDDGELRRVLLSTGLIVRADAAWLLDLEGGRWWRYDGLALGAARSPLTTAGVGRLRHVIDELARELGSAAQGDR